MRATGRQANPSASVRATNSCRRSARTSARSGRWAVRAVFKVLQRHIGRGEMEEVKQALPHDIRTLFPEVD